MNQIAIEDIATVFACEFTKYINKNLKYGLYTPMDNFIKMNYARRRKVVEKVLDKMELDIASSSKNSCNK